MRKNFLITDFGAVPGGDTLCTKPIQEAIDAAHTQGGGRVVVPAGTFLCGGIVLKANVELHLASGATLMASDKLEDYPEQVWRDRGTGWHFLYADGAHGASLTGRGKLDGNGPAFWQTERPSEWHFFREHEARPNAMVEINNTCDLLVEGVHLTNPAGWAMHLFDCDHVQVRGVHVATNLFGPNCDGIDLTGCRDVTVSDCHLSAADDPICLKTSRRSDGPRACERIAVTNCILETNCVAIRLGFESCWDFRDVLFSNCVIKRASRVIDLRMVEGGTLENVRIEGITGTTNCGWPMGRPIEITAAQVTSALGFPTIHEWYGKELPPTGTSAIRHVTLRDIDLETDGRITLAAQEGNEIRDIVMRDIRLRYPLIDDPEAFRPPEGWNGETGFLPKLGELARIRAAVVAKNIRELDCTGLRVEWPTGPVPEKWMLLQSAHRKMNPAYTNEPEAVRRGEKNPPFHVLWAERVSGCFETRAEGFGGAETLALRDCPDLRCA